MIHMLLSPLFILCMCICTRLFLLYFSLCILFILCRTALDFIIPPGWSLQQLSGIKQELSLHWTIIWAFFISCSDLRREGVVFLHG